MDLSWVSKAYGMAFVSLLLLGAHVGQMLGWRQTYVAGIMLLIVASVVGGFAVSGQ